MFWIRCFVVCEVGVLRSWVPRVSNILYYRISFYIYVLYIIHVLSRIIPFVLKITIFFFSLSFMLCPLVALSQQLSEDLFTVHVIYLL